MKRPIYNSGQIAREVLAQREAQRLSDAATERHAQEYRESQIKDLMVKARFDGKPLPLHCNDRSLDENTSGRDAFYNLANALEYELQLRGTEHLRRSLDNAKESLVIDGVEVPFHTKLAVHLLDRQLDDPKIEKAYDALQSLEAASTPEGELPSDVMAFLLIDVLVVNFERTQQQIEDKQQGNS